MATHMKQGFCMKEGTDETSYANASYIQNQVLSLTKPVKEKALKVFYSREQPTTTLCMADLGCSSAEMNTLSLMYEFINIIENNRRELGNGPLEYQIYLNDLPGNDFNTIFRSLGSFDDMLKQQKGDEFRHCFINGVPGSFYGRLFPSKHLHFVHSSYSLHWLSQVPAGIEDNKRNIYIARTSPQNVLNAYYDQFEKDFMSFLRCRSKEVVPGGMMVLTVLGRLSNELYDKESPHFLDFLATALSDMVDEGLIEEEKLNTFNFPLYPPSAAELGFWVEKEGSFALNEVHLSEVHWKITTQHRSYNHIDFARALRAISEHLIINHFGKAIIEELFHRYAEHVNARMDKENDVLINVTIVLTRKDQ